MKRVENHYFHQQIGLTFKEETREGLHLYGAQTQTLQKVDKKYMRSFEM
jgi:hypothetical protein